MKNNSKPFNKHNKGNKSANNKPALPQLTYRQKLEKRANDEFDKLEPAKPADERKAYVEMYVREEFAKSAAKRAEKEAIGNGNKFEFFLSDETLKALKAIK